MEKIKDCFKWAIEYLSSKEIESPEKYSEALLSASTGLDRIKLYIEPDTLVPVEKINLFKSMVERRINHEPIQYITNYTEFFGFRFYVDSRVFIPRPETEILVEEILREIERGLSPDPASLGARDCPHKIFDIGTGSGNIAIALSKMLKNCNIIATDVSAGILDVARDNACINKVEDKIKFLESSIFSKNVDSPLQEQSPFFDILVSNPPYIKKKELENLPKDVKDYEPIEALDGGDDGLDFYRCIINRIDDYLKKDGIIVFECGINQSGDIIDIISAKDKLSLKRVVKDFNGIDRVIIAKYNG